MDFSLGENQVSISFDPTPSTGRMSRDLAKFQAMEKEVYFSSKTILKGRVIDPDVRKYPAVQNPLKIEFSGVVTSIFRYITMGA